MHFHSEKDEESVYIFYIYYKTKESHFVLPNELIENSNVFGKINEDDNFILP